MLLNWGFLTIAGVDIGEGKRGVRINEQDAR